MRQARVFVLAVVAAVGLAATLSVGADELPPPPGWSQDEWDTLTPENQQIERELSPEPIAPEDVPEIVAAMEEWSATHSLEQIADELLADLLAEGPLDPDEGKIIEGITEAQLKFDLWIFDKAWVGVNADETISTQIYAGWQREDPAVGVVLVREVDLIHGDGETIPFEQEYIYPGHGGGFRIESESDGVLTFSRWIGDVQQPGTVLFNIDDRTFTSTLYLHGAGATANPYDPVLGRTVPVEALTIFREIEVPPDAPEESPGTVAPDEGIDDPSIPPEEIAEDDAGPQPHPPRIDTVGNGANDRLSIFRGGDPLNSTSVYSVWGVTSGTEVWAGRAAGDSGTGGFVQVSYGVGPELPQETMTTLAGTGAITLTHFSGDHIFFTSESGTFGAYSLTTRQATLYTVIRHTTR